MTKIAAKISSFLCARGVVEEEEKELYTYGYEIILENIGKTILLLIAGGIIYKFVATCIFVVGFVSLRSSCGGYHAKKAWQCDILTVLLWGIVICATPVVRMIVSEQRVFLLLIVLVSELIIIHYAPVEHKNNRLTKEKREKNRRQALVIGTLYGILVLLFSFKLIDCGILLSTTLLEVAILMIIPSEGRISHEEAE
ncbi:MAG: accessory gene regulator B family protein [Lachnospiraceae bacterium]